MDSKGAAILADPHPCGHIVYPYTDDTHVTEAVCLFASAGLKKGEAVVLVMTTGHRKPILLRLEQAGFNLKDFGKSGQLLCEGAGNLLSTFRSDGGIDRLQ